MLKVGVVEEFFFRVLFKSRLAAMLKSELGGIVVRSLRFGLIHAPGLYLRTGVTQEGQSASPSRHPVSAHAKFPAACHGSRGCRSAPQYFAYAGLSAPTLRPSASCAKILSSTRGPLGLTAHLMRIAGWVRASVADIAPRLHSPGP